MPYFYILHTETKDIKLLQIRTEQLSFKYLQKITPALPPNWFFQSNYNYTLILHSVTRFGDFSPICVIF